MLYKFICLLYFILLYLLKSYYINFTCSFNSFYWSYAVQVIKSYFLGFPDIALGTSFRTDKLSVFSRDCSVKLLWNTVPYFPVWSVTVTSSSSCMTPFCFKSQVKPSVFCSFCVFCTCCVQVTLFSCYRYFFLTELCQLAKDAGPCFDSMLQFYWSRDDAECRPFTYGGCGGNDNKFTTAEECYSRCASTDHHHRRTYSPADCFQPVAEGHCDETEIRWFFDAVREDCLAFYYSGCGSNGNNFRDYEDCFAFCSAGTLFCWQRRNNTSLLKLKQLFKLEIHKLPLVGHLLS